MVDGNIYYPICNNKRNRKEVIGMVEYVDFIKEAVEKHKDELEKIERAIKVLEKAGEDVTALKVKLSQAKEVIERFENALKEV